MEQKPNIETKVDETLNITKSVKPVEVPVFFTDKAINKLHSSVNQNGRVSFTGLLKIAAIVVLIIINVYTIKYILSPAQNNITTATATVNDLVGDYQTSDINEITFENKITNEQQ